ncbi:multiple sugar transport system substrate-binding protein [Virgibacillus halotolerans]|uniref:ABC transporter substrate-binding protein n=1 Tax=Virgibacillus halotolerans TaxID=1071053 RepID=UPI0019619B8F|nr:ABC transporter substrate-binding protein [Virgibacillus halotolerans]MBM7600038.1 multiple sugar transport system substrate-binding protein [Virgibacillus halotolerans]
MKVKKKLFGGFWILLLVVILAACSGDSEADGNDKESDDSDSNSDEQVTLTYARGVDTTGATEVLAEAFEKEHPNIKIEFQEMPSDSGEQHDQYVTAFSAKSAEIDVFDADVIWPAEFAQADYALDLDRFIEADDIDMDAYFEGTVKAGNFKGKQWAMPKFTDAGVLFYRTDIVDDPPETWDELIEQADELKGEKDTEFGYLMQASQYEGLITNAVEYIGAYGGAVLDEDENVVVDSPETVKAIEKMQEIVGSDFVPSNILNFTEIETESAFIEGNAVFARNWPYLQASSNDEDKSKVAGNVGFTTLPAGDDGSASALGGWMSMINRYSEHPEEAWEFVKFMTGPEGQKITAVDGGSAPTLVDLYDDEEVQDAGVTFSEPDFVEVLENAIPRPVSPIYPEISDIMQIELSKALTGDITAEEAAGNMQTKIEDAMED